MFFVHYTLFYIRTSKYRSRLGVLNFYHFLRLKCSFHPPLLFIREKKKIKDIAIRGFYPTGEFFSPTGGIISTGKIKQLVHFSNQLTELFHQLAELFYQLADLLTNWRNYSTNWQLATRNWQLATGVLVSHHGEGMHRLLYIHHVYEV